MKLLNSIQNNENHSEGYAIAIGQWLKLKLFDFVHRMKWKKYEVKYYYFHFYVVWLIYMNLMYLYNWIKMSACADWI